MRLRRGIMLALLLATTPSLASAQTAVECSFRDQLAAELERSIARGVALTEQANAALDAIGAVTAKASKPDMPVGQQLVAADAQHFQKQRDRLAELQGLHLIERRRQRDLGVINRMIAVADRSYRFGLEPAEGSPDDLASTALKLIREPLDKAPVDLTVGPDGCSLEAAFFAIKSELWLKVARYDLAKVKQLGEQLQQKYGFDGPIVRGRLDAEDRKVWELVMRDVVLPADRARGYLLDLEAGLTALRASDTVYASDREDLQKAASVEQLGAGLKKRIEANEFAPPLLAAISVWRVANENDKLK